MPIISNILTRKIPSWSFMDLVVWFLGLKIRINLGEMGGRYKDKEKKLEKLHNDKEAG